MYAPTCYTYYSYKIFNSPYTVAKTSIGVKSVVPIVTKYNCGIAMKIFMELQLCNFNHIITPDGNEGFMRSMLGVRQESLNDSDAK